MLDRVSFLDCAYDMVDKALPKDKQRVELCRILLEELTRIDSVILADYVEFYGIDCVVPGVVINLRIPIQAAVFNPEFCDIKLKE